MKNHRIFTVKDRDYLFGGVCFTEEQHELLLDLGYRYDRFHRIYEKYYRNTEKDYMGLQVCIPLGKEFIYYYNSGYHTLAELNETSYKGVMKELRQDLREMKVIGITR